jgi:hypothetical protein
VFISVHQPFDVDVEGMPECPERAQIERLDEKRKVPPFRVGALSALAWTERNESRSGAAMLVSPRPQWEGYRIGFTWLRAE